MCPPLVFGAPKKPGLDRVKQIKTFRKTFECVRTDSIKEKRQRKCR